MASFRNIYTSLMLVIARSTQMELARQVSYLKAENQILRSRLPDRISLTQREKNRLVRFAKNLASALNELATIVHPGTIRRWIREASAKKSSRRKEGGRPRTAEQIEKLILKLAKDNGWGYCRILGELRKLGIQSITRNTVKAILKRNGYDIGHIDLILRTAMDWYNRRRGHSARDNLPPVRDSDPPLLTAFPAGEIVCDYELDGHLKSYRRVAELTVVPFGKSRENCCRSLWRSFFTARVFVKRPSSQSVQSQQHDVLCSGFPLTNAPHYFTYNFNVRRFD